MADKSYNADGIALMAFFLATLLGQPGNGGAIAPYIPLTDGGSDMFPSIQRVTADGTTVLAGFALVTAGGYTLPMNLSDGQTTFLTLLAGVTTLTAPGATLFNSVVGGGDSATLAASAGVVMVQYDAALDRYFWSRLA